ncbi:PadR family transcriptional regulator [Natrinema soli]|uniref:PadR family transcriptional regulator n=1 Tax=Natrinema soli TaxID=1930624 RepID=A0ABD5SK83_9EURY|nr:PadR family transcriptional regulator [Natrinema soli]
MEDNTPIDEPQESITNKPENPCPLTNLTAFKRDQLFVIRLLASQNPHGLVIKEKLDDYYDDEITQGRLYQNLRELIEEGYVEKYPLDGRTNAYRPSEFGDASLEAHLEWERCCFSQNED